MKKLGFGLMRLPLLEDGKTIDIERVKAMADSFMEAGFTYFDTAAPYHGGESEVAFREAVAKRYPRDSYILADKLSLFKIGSAEDIPPFFDNQLTALGVDYIDYYLVHALGADRHETAKSYGVYEFVQEKKKEGKVRHVGFSFHDSPEVLDRILTEQPEMEFVQLQINYLDWLDEEFGQRTATRSQESTKSPSSLWSPSRAAPLQASPPMPLLFSKVPVPTFPAQAGLSATPQALRVCLWSFPVCLQRIRWQRISAL